MFFPFKLAFKPSLLPELTLITGSGSKQNHSAKLFLLNQATLSIIDAPRDILATATNLNKKPNTNIINVDNNKFYDYLIYFPILINICLFQH